MSKRVEAKFETVDGLAWGLLRFTGKIPYGKKTRDLGMVVDANLILQLADAIRGCPNVWQDPSNDQKPNSMMHALADERFLPYWIGHALWHIQNPERPMPCLPDGTKLIEGTVT